MNVIIIFFTAFLFYYALKQYRFYNNRKFELRLFVLRDKLRDYAIDGKINKNDWSFKYLDSSISKMTVRFKMLNMFHAMILFKNHNGDKRLESFSRQLGIALNKNVNLKEIYDEYNSTIKNYMFHKHLFFLSFILSGLYTALFSIKFIRKFKNYASNSIKNLSILPETSTSELYLRNC